MSYCRSEGKDKIIFATKEDHSTESTVSLGEAEEPVGLILPSGEINWGCPCLGGMATGPCGVEFREAFSCFHYSTAESKGSDCYEQFRTMQDCMSQYPAIYAAASGDDSEDADADKNTTEDKNVMEKLESVATSDVSQSIAATNEKKS